MPSFFEMLLSLSNDFSLSLTESDFFINPPLPAAEYDVQNNRKQNAQHNARNYRNVKCEMLFSYNNVPGQPEERHPVEQNKQNTYYYKNNAKLNNKFPYFIHIPPQKIL